MYDGTYQLFEYLCSSARACIKHQREIHALRPVGPEIHALHATLGPGHVSNIKGKYMPSALRAVLYHIYSDYRYL